MNNSRISRPGSRKFLLTIGAALLLGACSATSAPAPTTVNGGAATSPAPAGDASPVAAAGGPGKDISNFDPCSAVSDADLVAAITASAGDPSALGTVKASHVAVDGANTGLPGAKACSQTWTTTDSAGRLSQGGEPVIVTFDLYSNLADIQSGSPDNTTDYAASGAVSFEAPGDAGDPHLTKDGYLFRMSGNSDTALLKAIALGIASRL